MIVETPLHPSARSRSDAARGQPITGNLQELMIMADSLQEMARRALLAQYTVINLNRSLSLIQLSGV